MKGFGAGDKTGQVLTQMENISNGLDGIREALEKKK